jgi:phosphoglycolate phosphatase-like HAD superfamily hydrolase
LQADHSNNVATVVFDIDGVLADNSARYARLDRTNPDWTDFHRDQHLDPILLPNVTLLKMLWQGGYNIVLCTNRFEAYRPQTMGWLREHRIPFTRLIMRQPGTRYTGNKGQVISDLIEAGMNVVLAVDDDSDHCKDIETNCGVPALYVHSGYNNHFAMAVADLPDDPIGSA